MKQGICVRLIMYFFVFLGFFVLLLLVSISLLLIDMYHLQIERQSVLSWLLWYGLDEIWYAVSFAKFPKIVNCIIFFTLLATIWMDRLIVWILDKRTDSCSYNKYVDCSYIWTEWDSSWEMSDGSFQRDKIFCWTNKTVGNTAILCASGVARVSKNSS